MPANARVSRSVLVLGVALVLSGVAAFASSADRSDRITRTGVAAVHQRADGRLTTAPAPLTLADLVKLPKSSPQMAVARLWFYGQWGSPANVLQVYDRRVTSAIGRRAIAGAFTQQRETMVDARLKLSGVSPSANGVLVTVELLTTSDRPRPESFLLRRRGTSWRVVYDSFLEPALAAYVTSERQTAPRGAVGATAAARAGILAARRYRELYIGASAHLRRANRSPEAPKPRSGLPLPAP